MRAYELTVLPGSRACRRSRPKSSALDRFSENTCGIICQPDCAVVYERSRETEAYTKRSGRQKMSPVSMMRPSIRMPFTAARPSHSISCRVRLSGGSTLP